MAGKAGDLYVVATPIGNLGDMVPRALEILQGVDLIAVEDTRHSGRLLTHFGIDTPMLAYHDHSDNSRTEHLLQVLATGKSVALISDAGTPVIADPGYRLIHGALERGIRVSTVPGACAAIAALSISGLPSDRFAFEGFLPAKSNQRLNYLQTLEKETRTMVFYEAPHRIQQTLADMLSIFGEARQVTVVRELTKLHETILAGSLKEVLDQVTADPDQQRGEIVLLVRGCESSALDTGDEERDRILNALLDELPVRQAAALAARITGLSKNLLYKRALELKES